MVNLLFRSVMVLALLFGLLFAVGMAVIVFIGLPTWVAVAFAILVVLLQYLIGPFILEWIYKIEWLYPEPARKAAPSQGKVIARAAHGDRVEQEGNQLWLVRVNGQRDVITQAWLEQALEGTVWSRVHASGSTQEASAPKQIDPQLVSYIKQVCTERHIPFPRIGLIRDGNPNAFTFGHWPGDARLVVTQGILDLLTPEEQQAVVAHELGHIAHWDFVVMTIAAAVPLILYTIYIVTRNASRRSRRKGSGYIALIALLSYIAYLLSYYLALLLSRTREYFADQFSSRITRNPNDLSSALVKIAYGLAQAPPASGGKKDDARMIGSRALGIFDPKMAQALALASAGSGQAVSPTAMAEAMKWDLWNPWAIWYELSSTHPLPAKRIRALEDQAEAMGRPQLRLFRLQQPESYWDEFLADLGVMLLPILGGILGLIIAGLAWSVFGGALGVWSLIGIVLLMASLFWWWQISRVYPQKFDNKRTVQSLVGEVEVSAVRPIPCTVQGKIIGRGVPGLFFSEDLVVQDDTGFIILDYRQPLGFLEFLFGWLKAGELIGQKGIAKGWYRRAPRPVFEMREMTLEDGKKVTSYQYPFQKFLAFALIVVGLVLAVLGFPLT